MIALLAALTSTDLWFWDDALPPGQGVGSTLPDGRLVTRWDADKNSYEAAPVREATLETLAAVTAPGERHTVQEVSVVVTPGNPLSAAVVAGPALRLPEIPVGQTTPDHPVPIETLAPFSVLVDYGTSAVVPGPVRLPRGFWPMVAGSQVTVAGERYTVRTIEADAASLIGAAATLDRVPNPTDRRLPSGYLIAAAIAVSAGLIRWRRR